MPANVQKPKVPLDQFWVGGKKKIRRSENDHPLEENGGNSGFRFPRAAVRRASIGLIKATK